MRAQELLRPGALDGVRAVVWPAAGAIGPALASVGAEAGDGAAAADAPPPGLVVADAGAAFRAAGGGHDGLRAGIDGAFAALRDAATGGWIDAGAGRGVIVAPRPDDGLHADALRAACENLARTLSTEWARYGVTTVAVLPGPGTSEDEVGALCAFVAGTTGGYLSGCALTLA